MKKLNSGQGLIKFLGIVFIIFKLFHFISIGTMFILTIMVISTVLILEGFKQLILSITEKKK